MSLMNFIFALFGLLPFILISTFHSYVYKSDGYLKYYKLPMEIVFRLNLS